MRIIKGDTRSLDTSSAHPVGPPLLRLGLGFMMTYLVFHDGSG